MTNIKPRIRMVSFDIWRTLLLSNPEFHEKRTELIADYLQIPLAGLDDVIREVDDEIDGMVDRSGIQYGLPERICAIAQRYEIVIAPKDPIIARFDKAFGELIAAYPPLLTEDDLPDTFSYLVSNGLQLAVISNTGFIEGKHMRIALTERGLWYDLSFALFSNEVNIAKPNPRIFMRLCEMSGREPSSILHIGDNPVADYFGATDAGLQGLIYAAPAGAISIDRISKLKGIL